MHCYVDMLLYIGHYAFEDVPYICRTVQNNNQSGFLNVLLGQWDMMPHTHSAVDWKIMESWTMSYVIQTLSASFLWYYWTFHIGSTTQSAERTLTMDNFLLQLQYD